MINKKELYKFDKYGVLNKPNKVDINYEILKSKILDSCENLEEVNWAEIRFDSNAKIGKVTRKGGISIVNAIGWIDQLDGLINNVIGQYKDIIDFILPNGWIITQVALRISSPGDNELGLHTDTNGEYGIGILLNDWFSESATTCFLPKTHKWPFTFREITGFPRIPAILISKLGILQSVQGKAGTSYLFDHNNLHGRMANNTNNSNMAILISIFDIKKAPRIFNKNVIVNLNNDCSDFAEGILGSKPNSHDYQINKIYKNKKNLHVYIFFLIIKLVFLPLNLLVNFTYYSLIPKLKQLIA
tara:strand:- start:1378 stop:2280 length:903 start_codon:yes stop_codon:yes gene_type:complete